MIHTASRLLSVPSSRRTVTDFSPPPVLTGIVTEMLSSAFTVGASETPSSTTRSCAVKRLPCSVITSPGNAFVGTICESHGRVSSSSHASSVNSKNEISPSSPGAEPSVPRRPGCPCAPLWPACASVQVSPTPLRPPPPPDPPGPPSPPGPFCPPWSLILKLWFVTVVASVPFNTPIVIWPPFAPLPPRPPGPPSPPLPPSPPSPGSPVQCHPKNQIRSPTCPSPPCPPLPPRCPRPPCRPSSPFRSRFGTAVMAFTHISRSGALCPRAPSIPELPARPDSPSRPSREFGFVCTPDHPRPFRSGLSSAAGVDPPGRAHVICAPGPHVTCSAMMYSLVTAGSITSSVLVRSSTCAMITAVFTGIVVSFRK